MSSIHTNWLSGVWDSKLGKTSWLLVAEIIQHVELRVFTHAWVQWPHAQRWLGYTKILDNKGECWGKYKRHKF
jgi:hypothetical protein